MYPYQPGEAVAQARSRPWQDQLCAVGFPLLATMLFMLSTRHGIGIWPDSVRYMNLSPMPWDAPLYPGLLQMVAAAGMDISAAAWGIGLVLTALNAFLTWHVLRVASGRTVPAAVGTALIIIAPQSVGLYGLAMSEPLFITMILATLAAFIRYVESDDKGWLYGIGIGVGLASLTRFTGPALGAAMALFLLIQPRRTLGERIANVARVALPSMLLFAGWAVVSELAAGRSTGRPLEWLGNMTAGDWWLSFEALTAWIVPGNVPGPIRGALFLIALGAGLALVVRHARRALRAAAKGRADAGLIALPLAFFFFTYLAFMVLATAIEANLHLNSRYAYPIYGTSVMAVTIALARVRMARGGTRWLRAALAGVACVMIAGHTVRTAVRTHDVYRHGEGYASLSWRHSPAIAAVAALPRDAVLYSNGADAIGYLLRRPARYIPMVFELRTGRDEPAFPYAAQLARARADLMRGDAYVVFLNKVDWRFYMPPEHELADRLKLIRVARLSDGVIYRGAPQKNASETQ